MPNLGAASIGGYMDFVKQMLGLREQRLEEERYKQLERMENQKQMMSTIGDIQEGILGAGKEYQQNQLGNRLSEEYSAAGLEEKQPMATSRRMLHLPVPSLLLEEGHHSGRFRHVNSLAGCKSSNCAWGWQRI